MDFFNYQDYKMNISYSLKLFVNTKEIKTSLRICRDHSLMKISRVSFIQKKIFDQTRHI